jgi:YHYH protein/SLA1 homology domain 1, SHD1
MKNTIIALLCCVSSMSFAHNSAEHDALKYWFIANGNTTVNASFMMLKDGIVYLEKADNQTVKYPLSDLSAADQAFVVEKYQTIDKLNHKVIAKQTSLSLNFYTLLNQNVWLLGVFVFLLASLIYSYEKKEKMRHVYAVLMVGFIAGLYSFTPKPVITTTDPTFVDSAFVPFKSKVKTSYDATYFYVESQGIPTHTMMTGITNWQQQVPTPKCYTGTNAWSIPLNPTIATTPVSTATNFFKGAIAIAANGVPIFNAYNNRGEDAYLIGELDAYGGHCGKGDDYHYHIAPLNLDDATADILPIAFGLDGYAIYAGKEPTGVTMTTLDANHGHYLNGVYHYHATLVYPYAIGNMVGTVTKDGTDQIIPQPTGVPFRPAGNPLAGASITGCTANATNNGYGLTYKVSGLTYTINYSWTTSTAAFTFNFVSPTNVTTTSNYTGTTCVFVILPVELTSFKAKAINSTSVLTWQTASETKNKSFTIERSTNGTDYAAIGEVKGSGTTTAPRDYTFTDAAPSVNVNYYRLRQTDVDGKETLSQQVSVAFDKTPISIRATATHNALDVVLSDDKVTALKIFNASGQQVMTAKVQGAQRLDIHALVNGLYIIQTEKGETARFTKK